jgi:hypothetical protein
LALTRTHTHTYIDTYLHRHTHTHTHTHTHVRTQGNAQRESEVQEEGGDEAVECVAPPFQHERDEVLEPGECARLDEKPDRLAFADRGKGWI